MSINREEEVDAVSGGEMHLMMCWEKAAVWGCRGGGLQLGAKDVAKDKRHVLIVSKHVVVKLPGEDEPYPKFSLQRPRLVQSKCLEEKCHCTPQGAGVHCGLRRTVHMLFP